MELQTLCEKFRTDLADALSANGARRSSSLSAEYGDSFVRAAAEMMRKFKGAPADLHCFRHAKACAAFPEGGARCALQRWIAHERVRHPMLGLELAGSGARRVWRRSARLPGAHVGVPRRSLRPRDSRYLSAHASTGTSTSRPCWSRFSSKRSCSLRATWACQRNGTANT